MLLNEFLKEHRKVEQLEKQVAALTAEFQKVSTQLELSKSAPPKDPEQSLEIGARPFKTTQPTMHAYEVRPRKDRRGVDLISDVLLWYDGPNASRMQSATRSTTAGHIML